MLTAEQTEKYNILLEKMLKQHDHKAKENKKKKTAGNVVTTRKIKLSAKANSSLVPVQEYNKVFGKELSVNESLFAFCEHLEKAYIDNPNTPNYDEFDLPKGLEFQEHLKLFVNLKPHHQYDSVIRSYIKKKCISFFAIAAQRPDSPMTRSVHTQISLCWVLRSP